jgi:glycosyltransferase involved in cell wall biosynthesis
VEGKGQHVLLDAWAEVVQALPDAYLLLAGDGPHRRTLEAQTRRLGLESRVRFLGHLSDIRPALWVSDLMILPSLAEAFGIVVLEAMASGLAVVASRVGGIPEQIEEEKSGLLVPPGDAGALSAAILRVLTNPKLRLELVRGGREQAGRFTAERCFPALEARIARRPAAGAACT